MSLKDVKYLQIYAQHSQHFEAFVVGNREGLLELRKMIDEALKKGTSEGDFFPSDDEGYQAYMALIPDEKEELFQSLELPYTDQFGDENQINRISMKQQIKMLHILPSFYLRTQKIKKKTLTFQS